MNRQINLLTKESRGANPETLALLLLALVITGLIGYGIYNQQQISKLKDSRVANDAAIKEAAAIFKQKRIQAGLPDAEAMRQEIAALKSKLASNAQLIGLMEKGAIGIPKGHAAFLTTLASKHNPAIWITAIEMDDRHESLSIAGKSLNRESVMRYANSLNRSITSKTAFPTFTAVEMTQDSSSSQSQDLKRDEIRFRLN